MCICFNTKPTRNLCLLYPAFPQSSNGWLVNYKVMRRQVIHLINGSISCPFHERLKSSHYTSDISAKTFSKTRLQIPDSSKISQKKEKKLKLSNLPLDQQKVCVHVCACTLPCFYLHIQHLPFCTLTNTSLRTLLGSEKQSLLAETKKQAGTGKLLSLPVNSALINLCLAVQLPDCYVLGPSILLNFL